MKATQQTTIFPFFCYYNKGLQQHKSTPMVSTLIVFLFLDATFSSFMYNSGNGLRTACFEFTGPLFISKLSQAGDRSYNQGAREEMINEAEARTYGLRSMQM